MFKKLSAEKFRKTFITNSTNADSGYLATQVLPDGVKLVRNLKYMNDNNPNHLMDVMVPDTFSFDKTENPTCFLMIHGGAFVYGNKELNTNFSMRLAKKSGLPVATVNYTLMPEGDIYNMEAEIMAAMSFLRSQYGIKGFHMAGDSAGGYLALLTAVLSKDEEKAKLFAKEGFPDTEVLSVGLICGLIKFEKDDKILDMVQVYSDKSHPLPSWAFDLGSCVPELNAVPAAIVTGDKDFLKTNNEYLKALYDENNIRADFYCAKSHDDYNMFHVFPIGHPTWEEGASAIDKISGNALMSVQKF